MKILILSTNSSADFKDFFHAFLVKKGHEVVNLTLSNLFNVGYRNSVSFEMEEDEFSFQYKDRLYKLSEFDLIWKRRFDFNFLQNVLNAKEYRKYPPVVYEYMNREVWMVKDYILQLARLKEIYIINDFDETVINKLYQLNAARRFGLKTPDFLFTNSWDALQAFHDDNQTTITKPSSNFGYIYEKDEVLSHRTSIVNPEDLELLKSSFFPSFFQTGIENTYELKCLFIAGELLAVKQEVRQQKQVADIKQEYRDNNIRNTEYHLPEDLKKQVKLLCEHFRLDLCTIDFIKGADGNYYFLEINHDGIVDYYGTYISTNIYELFYKNLMNGKI
ncbi:MAG: hypothetical protein AAFQ94_29560 [Bacteroidota bacterium]